MPFVSVPFAAPTYNTQQSADRVIDLMLRQGDVAAHGAQAQGNIWGHTVAGLGQQAGQYLQQRQDQQAAQQREAAVNDIMTGWDPKDPETGYKKLSLALHDPVAAMHVTTGLMSLHENADKIARGDIFSPEATDAKIMALGALEKKIPGYLAKNLDTTVKVLGPSVLANKGVDLSKMAPEEATQALHAFYDQQTAPKEGGGFTLSPGQARYGPDGKLIASGPAAPEKEDTRSLDVRLAEAATNGDTKTYQTLLKAKRDEATAGRAPEKVEKPTDYTPDVKTSPSGVKYLDTSAYLGAKERGEVQDWARKNGVKMLNKDGAGAIEDIDVALRNNSQIMGQIEAKLPKDALGRVIAGPSNKLEQLFQTDEDLAAFASWRTAAIRNLRATAGSKGLRLNSAEIELAVENDIPKITDTIGVARRKLQNVEAMLRNGETSLLGAAPAPSGPPAPAVGSPGSKYKIVSP